MATVTGIVGALGVFMVLYLFYVLLDGGDEKVTDELFEYAIYVALLVALAIPLSGYLNKIMAGEHGKISRILVPVENLVYRICRIDVADQMNWKRYLSSALIFSPDLFGRPHGDSHAAGLLPFNPEGFDGLSWDLAFNTAASFVTNTNWQSYSGEAALSYFSQAIGLTVQNFVTPAVGMAVLFALFRGLVGEGVQNLGNFFADVTRAILFVLLPLSFVLAIVDVAQGSPQNLAPYETVQLVEPVGIDAEGNVVDAQDPAAVDVVDEGRRARRASGEPSRHQAARHQRRRLQRRELRKSAGEPHAAVEPAAVHIASAHPVRLGVQLRPLRL